MKRLMLSLVFTASLCCASGAYALSQVGGPTFPDRLFLSVKQWAYQACNEGTKALATPDAVATCVSEKTKAVATAVYRLAWNTTSLECPVYSPPRCQIGTVLVSGGIGPDGCELAPTCQPDGKTVKKECPVYSPPRCQIGTVLVGGGIGPDGCQLAPTCQPENPLSKKECPVYNAPLCAEGYALVSGAINSNGCQAAPTCQPDGKTVKKECPVYNAPICGEGYSAVAGQPRADGCPAPLVCQLNAGKSAYVGQSQ